MGAFVIALAVVGALWAFSQTASATDGVVLVHVMPDGSDYTGNDYCPGGGNPVDDDGDTVIDRAIDDCNNIVSQNHVIRTEGLAGIQALPSGFTIEGVGVIVNEGYFGTLAEVISRPLWNPANDGEACLVIHSMTPGETRVVFSYFSGDPMVEYTTEGIMKEWDSLLDTVILKTEIADEDGDTDIDADDHHLADQQSTWENDPVTWDEGWKRLRSYPPVHLTEIAHGGHAVLIDHETIDLHQPTEGAIIKAWITSDHGCTYFTTPDGLVPFIPFAVPYASFGTVMNGISDMEGRFVGPRAVPAITMPPGLQVPQIDNDGDTLVNEDPIDGIDNDTDGSFDEDPVDSFGPLATMPPGDYDYQDIYVDTTCEEQAVIHILVGYPDSPGSLKVPVEEWIGINWTTVEEAKQPQIRWAGEEIVLAKRWSLPDENFPNVNDDGTLKDICPLAFAFARYNRLVTSNAGDLVGGLPEMFEPYTQPDRLITIVDAACITRALASSEDQGEGDFEVTLHEWCTEAGAPIDICSYEAWQDLENFLLMVNADILANTITTEEGIEAVWDEWWNIYQDGEYFLDPDEFDFGEVFNKHAFLVWWLKIYETKLANIPLTDGTGRTDHNAGVWGGEDPIDSEGSASDTLNVSQDTLLRVTVKGWFEGGNNSGRGAVCVDKDGDGNGLTGADASEPGVPYPIPSYEAGCTDLDDEILDHGHWVLPDDLPALAGEYAGLTRKSWDVMNDIDEAAPTSSGTFIGPKSTLDSHDAIARPWVPCILGFDTVNLEWIYCDRKTVAPDQEITVADAIMPPLKIRALIADPADAGFLKGADKDGDVGIESLYQQIFIPSDPEIPPNTNNCSYDWDSWGWNYYPSGAILGPYEFYHVINKPVDQLSDCSEVDESLAGELCNAGIGNQMDQAPDDVLHPRIIEFYTDNRGLGYFFANGDYNLDFAGCSIDPVTGTPDCSPGDIVGTSTIEVIGDYPYCRKHSTVLSNPVEKTWEWGGFKTVTAKSLDPNHTVIIAHLKDRDGFCKYDVDTTVTPTEVIYSPSEHPVQHEEITFQVTSGGQIWIGGVGVSPSGTFNPSEHIPLAEAVQTGWQDGVQINETQATALAEDVRVLAAGGFDQEAVVDDECQAWIIIEHAVGEVPEVSVIFDDPEGTITRHYPPEELLVNLVVGWNDKCYTGPEADLEAALTEANIIDDVLVVWLYDAAAEKWYGFIPGRTDIPADRLTTIAPYDQLWIASKTGNDWLMEITALPVETALVEGWNSVCYAGGDKAPADASESIQGDFSIIYKLGIDQKWQHYVFGRPDLDTMPTLNRFDSVFVLVTNADGATWKFDQ
jgi:hypothetical protein